jgi:hypothetical protein
MVAAGVLFDTGTMPHTTSWWPFGSNTREKGILLSSELRSESGVTGLATPCVFVCGVNGGFVFVFVRVGGGGVVGIGLISGAFAMSTDSQGPDKWRNVEKVHIE